MCPCTVMEWNRTGTASRDGQDRSALGALAASLLPPALFWLTVLQLPLPQGGGVLGTSGTRTAQTWVWTSCPGPFPPLPPYTPY